MVSYAKSLQQGAGLHQDTQIGPLVSQEQHERVLSYIEKGKAEGAKAVAGGNARLKKGILSPRLYLRMWMTA